MQQFDIYIRYINDQPVKRIQSYFGKSLQSNIQTGFSTKINEEALIVRMLCNSRDLDAWTSISKKELHNVLRQNLVIFSFP